MWHVDLKVTPTDVTKRWSDDFLLQVGQSTRGRTVISSLESQVKFRQAAHASTARPSKDNQVEIGEPLTVRTVKLSYDRHRYIVETNQTRTTSSR